MIPSANRRPSSIRKKLLWLNQHYIREYPLEKLVETVSPFWAAKGLDLSDKDFTGNVVTDLKARAKTLVDMADTGLFYFQDEITFDAEAAAKFLTPEATPHLVAVAQNLPAIAEYTKSGIELFLRNLAEEQQTKLKIIAQPLRVALTGKTVSPGIDEVMITLGKDRTIGRIERAIAWISEQGKA